MADSTPLDRRLHAYRPDLADARLRGQVEASRFVAGELRQVRAAILPVRRGSGEQHALDTEALFGELLTVFAIEQGWAWVQLERDRYVGYVPAAGLSREVSAPTHRVRALATFVYPEPDMKRPPRLALSLNAEVTAVPEDATFLRLATGGYVVARHLAEIGQHAPDPVAVAARFVGVPYLWGGRTRIGVDCSGLVQLGFEAAGIACPRDSDLQQTANLGRDLPVDPPGLARGDLVFWPGHVGLMLDAATLLHANAHHMAVVAEPLASVVARQLRSGEVIACIKRPRAAPPPTSVVGNPHAAHED